MRYKKNSDGTVQCIITCEDMEAYGLTMKDIFERNEKGEDFLRDIIERAHEEVGYEVSGGSIAMQITPLKDNGLIVTFSEEGVGGFQNLLDHLKEAFAELGGSGGYRDAMEQLHKLSAALGVNGEATSEEGRSVTDHEEPVIQEQTPGEDKMRILVFRSMSDLLQYVTSLPNVAGLKSRLYKSDGAYFLQLYKNRISWKEYNRVCAMALDFGMLVPEAVKEQMLLEEHGECIIDERALIKLKKVVAEV